MSFAQDIETCRTLLRGGSKTFFAASLLLPKRVAEPAIALYAFCRLADDAVDLGDARLDAVARLRDRLDLAYAGRPADHAADRAFADVVSRFAIPRELPEALLEGLAWDAEGRRYDSASDLHAYAVRVAGAVGAMMTLVMGAREPHVVARACDLGIAMQLTNIARDIGEDARAGRLYLPRQWLREAGVDPDSFLARPMFDARIAAVAARLLAEADVFYARATQGVAALPRACRPGIHAARLIYAEIGREVERRGCDSVGSRAVVPMSRKLSLLAGAFSASLSSRSHAPAPAQREAQYLLDAIAAARSPRLDGGATPRFGERVVWVLDLFERLERRDQMARGRLSP
jgi:phytoene synthase